MNILNLFSNEKVKKMIESLLILKCMARYCKSNMFRSALSDKMNLRLAILRSNRLRRIACKCVQPAGSRGKEKKSASSQIVGKRGKTFNKPSRFCRQIESRLSSLFHFLQSVLPTQTKQACDCELFWVHELAKGCTFQIYVKMGTPISLYLSQFCVCVCVCVL